jgi:uncharacterized protein (DUF362 family)
VAEQDHIQADVGRRAFLKRGGAALLAAGGLAGGAAWLHDPTGKAGLAQPKSERLPNYFQEVDYPISAPRIGVARGPADSAAAIHRLVTAAVESLGGRTGLGLFVERGDVVLLKPNVGFERAPQFAATTNPEVIRSVIRLCREAGAAEIIVSDNPIESPASCFARSGITAVAREEGVRLMIPAKVHFKPLAIRPVSPDGTPYRPDPARNEALGTWPVFWAPLRRATKVIGMPVIKDHNLSSASMGLKNWYGLLGGRRNQFHQAIHDIISDLGLMMSPTLTVVDGIRVMMKNGPTGGSLGDVKQAGTVVASVDPLAADAWCYENLLERDPATLPYLELSQEKFGEQPTGPRSFGEAHRFASRDWQGYKTRGLIVEEQV